MESYEKFNYLLRPAKQVERKLLIEGLHQLASGGFRFRNYRYIGFGSPFYADFALFHKYLYIDDCICVEHGAIGKRMKFNRPFPHVKLHLGEVSEVVASLDRKKRHVVWLDYDYPLDQSVIGDLAGFASTLPSASIFIVTVEADPRISTDLPRDLHDQVASFRLQTLQAEIGSYVDGGVKLSHLSPKKLAALYATVLVNQLHDQLGVRSLKFIPLFNFAYADGRQMLSVGGVIGDDAVKKRVEESGIYDLPFVGTSVVPKLISVPPLTTRERLWLDQNLRSTSKRPFEVKATAVSHYRQYYRHYPNYFEALL